jgi:uncharacterized membrane protein YhaH (DUF805 family)
MINFSRRINGSTYYAGVGLGFLLAFAAALLGGLPKLGATTDIIIGVAIILAAILLFVYWACLIRQRANDIGWHPLVLTLLALTTPLFLALGLIAGQKNANKYGPVPPRGVRLLALRKRRQ